MNKKQYVVNYCNKSIEDMNIKLANIRKDYIKLSKKRPRDEERIHKNISANADCGTVIAECKRILQLIKYLESEEADFDRFKFFEELKTRIKDLGY